MEKSSVRRPAANDIGANFCTRHFTEEVQGQLPLACFLTCTDHRTVADDSRLQVSRMQFLKKGCCQLPFRCLLAGPNARSIAWAGRLTAFTNIRQQDPLVPEPYLEILNTKLHP